MRDVTLHIHTEDGNSHRAQTPLDINAGEFIKEIVGGLRLSTGGDDTLQRWSLYDKGTGAFLDPGRTLVENGVLAGQDLYLSQKQINSVFCHYCRMENSSSNNFCQGCGKSLTGNRGASDIKVHVHVPDGTVHSAEVPASLMATEFVADLVRTLGFAVRDGKGANVNWKLDDKDSGRALLLDRTLGENQVHNGHHLFLRAYAEEAPPPRPGQVALWKIGAALGVLALAGVGAIFAFRPHKPAVTLSLDPQTATLRTSQRQQFKSKVTGSDNQQVQWSMEPAIGTITSEGLYGAPSSIVAEQSVRITATSKADARVSAVATLTLMPAPKVAVPVSIVLVPKHASISPGQQQEFIAKVSGTPNRALQWSISPEIGSIAANGVYKAPASVPTEQTVKVTATSKADPHKSASVMLTLLSNVLVQIDPSNITLAGGKKQKFKANVTGTGNKSVEWSISPMLGAISEKGEYKAPASAAPGQTVRVTATSNADRHKSASATVTLTQKR